VALPGITRTSVADTTAWVGARVVVVAALVDGGALADGFPLELPHPATKSAPRQAAAAIFGTLTREFMCSPRSRASDILWPTAATGIAAAREGNFGSRATREPPTRPEAAPYATTQFAARLAIPVVRRHSRS
jgi:hypothetical protein